jgi:hypothetical protein
MLVNRTIQNPKEKLYLLFKFIKNNKIERDLFSMHYGNENTVNQVWVNERLMIHALNVNPQYFRLWFKDEINDLRSYFDYNDYNVLIENFSYNKLIKYGNKRLIPSVPTYIPIGLVIDFIYNQYVRAEKNKNGDDYLCPSFRNLYISWVQKSRQEKLNE